MSRFLSRPESINGFEIYPITIDIHLGIVKISKKAILDDDTIKNTESFVVRTAKNEVLNRLQTSFAMEFEQYEKLKDLDIRPTEYPTRRV